MFAISGWTIREAEPLDADALSLIGATTIVETYAGLIDTADMLDFCGTDHSADAYRHYF